MPQASTEADRNRIRELDGLYAGQLTTDELESFNRCIQDGKACRDYNHPAGFFVGVAKVRWKG